MDTKAYPEYGIPDWGDQVAEIAAHFIRENGLSNRIIICGWSMGGKIAASISDAARKAGLVLDVFVAVSADPPVTGLLPNGDGTSLPGRQVRSRPAGNPGSSRNVEFFDIPDSGRATRNSPDDAENVLFDTSDWAFIRNRVIVDRM